MPNWEPGHCLQHSIDNNRRHLDVYERDDQHCEHTHGEEVICCWCGETWSNGENIGRHGPFQPKRAKK